LSSRIVTDLDRNLQELSGSKQYDCSSQSRSRMLSQLPSALRSRLFVSVSLLALGLPNLLLAPPSSAAENLKLRYGIFAPTVPVRDLRTYAETGKASPRLALLLGVAGSRRQPLIRTSLQRRVSVGPEKLEQMLATEKAQDTLSQAAAATLRPDPAGVTALRTGLLEGSQDPAGLGLISFLEAYPSDTLTIDVRKASQLAEQNQDLLQDLKELDPEAEAAVKAQPAAPTSQPPRGPALFRR
jgi:hypothetical protein